MSETIIHQVMFTEEMEADPLGVLEQAFQFLGLDLLDAQGQQVFDAPELCIIGYPH